MAVATKTSLLLLAAALCCGAAKAQPFSDPRPTTAATTAVAGSAPTAAEVGDSESIETSGMTQELHGAEGSSGTEPAARTVFSHHTTFDPGTAFNRGAASVPDAETVSLPEYAYCEIIAGHLPGYRGNGVLFDFGQKTEAWAYNRLEDAEGRKLIFASKIEALNYMVCRGWEFVEAYTSGEENQYIHYLLRIPTTALSAEEKQHLLTSPQAQEIKKSRKKK